MNCPNEILLKKGRIVVDASSIIYLEKISLLKTYSKLKTILIPEPIYTELICKNDSTDYNQYLKIVSLINRSRLNKDNLTVLKYPDVTLISLYYLTNPDGILTDDGKICKYCHANNITYLNTPMVILSLKLCNLINLSEFYEKLDEVYQIGRYSKYVRDYMDSMIKKYIVNV